MKNLFEPVRKRFTMTVISKRDDGSEAEVQKHLYLPFAGLKFNLYQAVLFSPWNDSNRKSNWYQGVTFTVLFPDRETFIFQMHTGDNPNLQESYWQEVFEAEMSYLRVE